MRYIFSAIRGHTHPQSGGSTSELSSTLEIHAVTGMGTQLSSFGIVTTSQVRRLTQLLFTALSVYMGTVLMWRQFRLFCEKRFLDTAHRSYYPKSHVKKVSVIFSLIDDLYIRGEMSLKYMTLLLKLTKMKKKSRHQT